MAGLIAASALELARDPALFAAARRDLSIVPPIIEEVLRVASPIHSMYRTANEDVEIGGARRAAVREPEHHHAEVVCGRDRLGERSGDAHQPTSSPSYAVSSLRGESTGR